MKSLVFALVGIAMLPQGCDLKERFQVRQRAESGMQPYFPSVSVAIDEKRRTLFGYTCTDLGAAFLRELPQVLEANAEVRQLKQYRALLGLDIFALGFEKYVLTLNLVNKQYSIIPSSDYGEYAEAYAAACSKRNLPEPTASAATSHATLATWHPDDTLLADQTGTIWLISRGRRRMITSQSALETLHLDGTKAISATQQELSCFPVGNRIDRHTTPKLLRAEESPTVYLITDDGYRRALQSESVLLGLGYTRDEVQLVSPSQVTVFLDDPHAPTLSAPFVGGSLVRATGTPTVFVVTNGKIRPIGSGQVFEMLHYRWDQVNEVPSELLEPIPVLPAIMESDIRRCESR